MNLPFRTWITPDCLERLNMYATEAVNQKRSEIGGYAKVIEEGDDVFVTDLFIPSQKTTGGTFDVTGEMDNEFIREMRKAGRGDEVKDFKSIVHSHPVGMGPSMSSVDVDAIKRRAEGGECYSLIISASHNADSTKLFMHYCCQIGGKTLMFRDMPVQVGWNVERRDLADELVEDAIAKLGLSPTKSDRQQITDAIRIAMCTELPATFEKQRKELRAQIAKEVGEKLSAPSYGYQGGFGYRTGGAQLQPPQNRSWPRRNASEESYAEHADITLMWDRAQDLFSVGYEKVNVNTGKPVSNKQAKEARRLHKNLIIDLNTKLRKLGSFGMGDLVVVNEQGLANNLGAADMVIVPHEVEDFGIKNGLVSYIVGGEIMWPDELELVTSYEEVMGWAGEKVNA